jgi:hypothetical protein
MDRKSRIMLKIAELIHALKIYCVDAPDWMEHLPELMLDLREELRLPGNFSARDVLVAILKAIDPEAANEMGDQL